MDVYLLTATRARDTDRDGDGARTQHTNARTQRL